MKSTIRETGCRTPENTLLPGLDGARPSDAGDPGRVRRTLSVAIILLVWLTLAGSVSGQQTAFFYQGRLDQSGSPATGLYHMRFTLFDAETGPALIAGPINNTNVFVTNGVFMVTLNFPPGVFDGAPRWLEIDVRTNSLGAYQTLAPRQPLLPTPYAMHAGIASNIVSGSVVKSLNSLKDNITLAAGSNLTITPSGNTLTLSAAGAGGSGIWSVLNNNAYYSAGNVSIGSAVPRHRLRIGGGVPWTSAFWGGAVELDNASAIGWNANGAGNRFGIGQSHGGLYFFSSASDPGNTANPANYLMTFNDNGNVGIGTTTPGARLEVASGSGDIFRLVGYEPFITFFDSNHGYNRTAIQSVDGSFNIFTEAYLRGIDPFGYIHLHSDGRVGFGSATPISKLDIISQDALSLIGYQPFLTLRDVNAGYARSRIQGVNGDIVLEPESYINGSNPNAAVVVANSGNVSVSTLTIRGGADLAEPFPMDANVAKGSVVVIDHENPGRLKLATRAYDKRVAGIVSGANGVNPGIALKQEGALDQGENVALTGRVYVLADATHGAIEPGDLLTSSSTPGHAMKVTDHRKAQGAILGKAMGALKRGRGHVLVLVTLQ